MNKQREDSKQYVLLSEAWYGTATLEGREFVDEVIFGFYPSVDDEDEGIDPKQHRPFGEMVVRWYDLKMSLDGEPNLTPRLEVFNDAWAALASCQEDVITALAEVNGQDITPQQFCLLLGQCGFTDHTPRER